MNNSSFTLEESLKKVKTMSSFNIPSSLEEVVSLIVFGMVNNYDVKYENDILNMLNYTSLVITDNTKDIYVKNVKNIVSNNKINIFLDSNNHYAVYIDKNLNGLGLLENLVKAFNEIFTYSIDNSSLRNVFTSIQCEEIIKYILNNSNYNYIDIDRYTCNSNIGENLFKKIYNKDLKGIIDEAIIKKNINIIKDEVDSILGFGSYEMIKRLYDNIVNYSLSNNTYYLSSNYVKLRKIINEYLVKKYGIL